MPKPTVSANLKRLEAAGFLRREIDASDLRRHRLPLTPDGPQGQVPWPGAALGGLRTRLQRLSAAQQRELRNVLVKMS